MWQVRHHLLARIAQHCHVAWIGPAHHWRSLLRFDPALNAAEAKETTPASPRLDVRNAPWWLPRFHASPRLDTLSLKIRLRQARSALLQRGARQVLLYLWRPEFAPALGLVDHDLSCYHIDDEYSFSEDDTLSGVEVALLRDVDQVIIHSRTLLERKGRFNCHTAQIPNGVDYARYATPVAEPTELADIPRPRIGYSGWLKPQIDWELLRGLTARHANWSFVFVGPHHRHPHVEEHIAALSRLANVFFLGPRPTGALHAYAQNFDICVMPYLVNGYTKYIYPVKVHEYLATGNPVVSSRLANLTEFSDVLSFASDLDEWSSALSRALTTASDPQRRLRRQRTAERHDWNTLAAQVIAIFKSRLEEAAVRHV
jgi:glycosyltransferase involved in cell wall biosynthesis